MSRGYEIASQDVLPTKDCALIADRLGMRGLEAFALVNGRLLMYSGMIGSGFSGVGIQESWLVSIGEVAVNERVLGRWIVQPSAVNVRVIGGINGKK